ncbi:hypothetical protein LCGC14_0012180 [marine sediment metagenome]|uniref:Peptidoglycan-binding protein CsiV n=2 Tax=root TaxID=1 RepID=A0A0F9YHD4_9ZZZZ|nr:hypothetical protein [Pseudohongiella sp.]HEA63586.1 hypothetical protein [Pseudohongiella sp.]
MKNSVVHAYPMPSFLRLMLIALALAAAVPPAMAQDGNRWYQIEVTVFAHENSNILQEQWPADAPALNDAARTRELDSLLQHLTPDDWATPQPSTPDNTAADAARPAAGTPPLSAGPEASRSSDYRLPDTERDAFVALPASDHDFTQTNRALNQSPDYRVLTHLAWRQPVMRADAAIPIAIVGGRRFDDQHELEGTLTIRFNQSRDRVMLDTDLTLTQFSTQPPDTGAFDAQAFGSQTADSNTPRQFFASRVFPMQDSRAMRSNEFHYLDHPAIGVLVQVFPYEPPAPVSSFRETGLPQ